METLFGDIPERRGSRLPEDWKPSNEARKFAETYGLDWQETAALFRDYWIAIPGKAGRKVNWTATWRNWCRRTASHAASGKKPPSGQIQALATPSEDAVIWWARLKNWKPGGFWSPFWGPPPTDIHNFIPRPVLQRWQQESAPGGPR